MTRTDDSPPGPLELMESARAKYSLALGRLRRGPPELALLSLHGSIEDALRGYAMGKRLPAAGEVFPQLLDALAADAQAPLSAAEAEGIRRMHRLRARVAHGEQINLAAGTVDAYHRLTARVLPRCGVLVVGPEDGAETTDLSRLEAEPAPPWRRGDEVEAIPPRRGAERGRATTRLERPPRERSAYPDDELARYAARPRRAGAPRAELSAPGGRGDIWGERWQRSQSWLLPLLIIVSIFLIGAAVSISLQQIRAARALPTAAAATAFAPQITTATAQPSADAGATVNGVAPAAASPTAADPPPTPSAGPGGLAVGQQARVISQIELHMRERPGTGSDNPILSSLAPGTLAEVIAGPTQADGLTWWKVRAANIEGWCAGEFLEPQ